LFRRLSAYPESLETLIDQSRTCVVIDEIQKLPVLLDLVHSILESRPNLRFILTGSSGRKLRSGGVNLFLGGGAPTFTVFFQ
jgi:predicted AAA+ superfamily ATPase